MSAQNWVSKDRPALTRQFRLLHEAREKAYTEKNILSAFEATGICPLDAYRTALMQDFRLRAQNASGASLSGPSNTPGLTPSASQYRDRQEVIENCHQLIEDPSASSEELKSALNEALGVIEGSEARVVTLESELEQIHEASRQKRAGKSRGGRVGRARVYTQGEVKEIREQEEARAQGSAGNARGRGRGRGGHKGRAGTSKRKFIRLWTRITHLTAQTQTNLQAKIGRRISLIEFAFMRS